MTAIDKRDISISMEKANLYGIFFALPAVIIELAGFILIYSIRAFKPVMGVLPLAAFVIAGIILHEVIHGIFWAILGKKPLSAIKFGFLWKTFSPYAHCKEPLEVQAYRLGTFMPRLILGFIPFVIAMWTGNGDWMWFSLFHTTAACGDWLVLWVIRAIKPGSMVEDHPTNAGCYVLDHAS
jgi:hypothetical protein